MKVCKIICLLAKSKEQAKQKSLCRCLRMELAPELSDHAQQMALLCHWGRGSYPDNPTLTSALKFSVYWEVEASLVIVNDLELSMYELILQASHKIEKLRHYCHLLTNSR